MSTPISRPDGHLGDVIRQAARRGGQQPFLTFYDSAAGERTELSHATWENWVAKAANLLVDEFDLRTSATLAVALPTSWMSAVVIAAAWRAGLVVDLTNPSSAPAAAVGEHGRDPGAEPQQVLVVGTGMAGRLTTDPGDGIGFAEEVLAHGDDFPDPAFPPSTPALVAPAGEVVRTWSHADLIDEAQRRAVDLGLQDGERFLSTSALSGVEGLVASLLVPLVIGGGVVLVANAVPEQLERIAASERCRVVVRA